jgi:hypothetical protein
MKSSRREVRETVSISNNWSCQSIQQNRMSSAKCLDVGKSKIIVVIASSIYVDDFFVTILVTNLVTKLNSSNNHLVLPT